MIGFGKCVGRVIMKYILFGAGDYGKKALLFLGKENIKIFFDNDQKNGIHL